MVADTNTEEKSCVVVGRQYVYLLGKSTFRYPSMNSTRATVASLLAVVGRAPPPSSAPPVNLRVSSVVQVVVTFRQLLLVVVTEPL